MKLLALAMIVRGADIEAPLLERCLDNLKNYVDGIFITVTHKPGEEPNKKVLEVCKKFNVNISYFEWCKDFAKARNFNFSQVPKEYEYILWCDADDVFRGLDTLRDTIEKNKHTDAFAFFYMYDFDEYKQPTVVHKKTQIVRNDGCVEWKGALHEDFKENRALDMRFVDGIERMHLTTGERVEIAKKRNVDVSENEAKIHPDDPRVYWNLGNSYIGDGKFKKALTTFKKFLEMSNSDEEKYLVHTRMGEIYNTTGERDKAIQHMQIAIGMRPDYPDAYNQLGYLYFSHHNYDKAEQYLLWGLVKRPPYHSMIVFNPRDYDYNPMMLLAKVYFNKSRPDLALPMLKGCLKIYPEDKKIKGLVAEMEREQERLVKVLETVDHLKDETDKEKIKYWIEKLPTDLRSHPAITSIYNKHFIKTESSGKDLVYYCGMTDHEWNPDLFKTKGFGGSEEAVINLSKQWASMGWNVTVYNNCGTEPMTRDGVTYKPFWMFNVRDKQDVLIIWRHPKLLDYDLNCSKIYVDLHDVISAGEFNEKRLAKLSKIFVKTKFHRSLFPNIPDEKMVVIPNGMDFGLFDQEVEKNQYLMVNTSSPDRSMDVLPKLFKEVKKRVPQARLKWAYGWDVFNSTHEDNIKMLEWRDKIISEMEEAGVEVMGRLPQKECAKLYLEGNILAFPTEFAEIDCITVKKAQACGCIPVTTDFGALEESVQYGIKVHSKKTKDNWCRDFQFHFGLEDEKAQQEWIDKAVEVLQTPLENTQRYEMKMWTKKFEWPLIAKQWNEIL